MNDANDANGGGVRMEDGRDTVCYCKCPYRLRTPGVEVVNYDITFLLTQLEKYRQEEVARKELEAHVEVAESASRFKSEFLARMSHEIRTPLNVIIGVGDIMRTDNFDETQLQNFKDMAQMARTLLALINDILDFSKIEAGKMELVPVHYNFRAMLDNVTSMCRFLARDKGLDFRASIAPDLPDVVYGDETRVRQVLTNLLNNAVKYTFEGVVGLSVKRKRMERGEFLVVMVRDTGRGIKEDDQNRLFGSFAQFDLAHNRGMAGTGLGLTITKQLLELMGGFVTVSSEYGLGSTFVAHIPLIPGDPARVEDVSKHVLDVQATAATRVLVVDDMRLNLNVIQGMLERHGINSDTAERGEEALQKVAALAEDGLRYDLVFMDHMMPGMDGLETTRRIRELEALYGQGAGAARVPIIAFSANVIRGAQDEFLSAGMDDCISKPVRLKELNRILTRWLPEEKVVKGGAGREVPAPAGPGGGAESREGGDARGVPVRRHAGRVASASSRMTGEYRGITPLSAGLQCLGVDLDAALEHLGGMAELREYLGRFASDCGDRVAMLRAAVGQREWGDYRVAVHGLKSVFKAMGAMGIHDRLLSLERSAQEGRHAECEGGTQPVLEEIADFHEQVTALLVATMQEGCGGDGCGGAARGAPCPVEPPAGRTPALAS